MEGKRSTLEQTFFDAWCQYGRGKIPAEQYRFSPGRRFRFDFAWPKRKVAVELDGFGYGGKQGGHQTIVGISNQHEKQNHAIELGWIVLRYTTRQLGSKEKREAVCQQVLRVLESRPCSAQ